MGVKRNEQGALPACLSSSAPPPGSLTSAWSHLWMQLATGKATSEAAEGGGFPPWGKNQPLCRVSEGRAPVCGPLMFLAALRLPSPSNGHIYTHEDAVYGLPTLGHLSSSFPSSMCPIGQSYNFSVNLKKSGLMYFFSFKLLRL